MDKNILRKKYVNKRSELQAAQIDNLSLDIANQALKLNVWDKSNYHIFLSIVNKNEVNTEYLLHILQGKDKSVFIPKADFTTNQMQHILLQENTIIKKSPYGIPEPTEGLSIPATSIDVVFVPVLAFDKQGNRLGYGKGFYDRFLASCREDAIFIGLSFFTPENQLPTCESDIPLHFCITPQNTYQF